MYINCVIVRTITDDLATSLRLVISYLRSSTHCFKHEKHGRFEESTMSFINICTIVYLNFNILIVIRSMLKYDSESC